MRSYRRVLHRGLVWVLYYDNSTAYAAGALGAGCKFVVLLSILMGAPRVGYRAQGNEHWSSFSPLLQCERGCQQGGAGDPSVVQGQGEASGVSWWVSMVGQPGMGSQWLPPALHCHQLFILLLSLPRDVSVELPFVLMHPKPHDHITLPRPQSGEHATHPKPPKEALKPGQWRKIDPSSTHPPTHFSPPFSCS